MRKTPMRLILGLLLVFAFCTGSLAENASKRPTLVQVGVIDALLAGGYEGSMTLGELRSKGDIGLGTFDALDGEMVVLDGVVYQVPSLGPVRRPPQSLTTPFAQVTRLSSPSTKPLSPGSSLAAVEALLDAALGDLNSFAVVRIDAAFDSVTARSVPRQDQPYRPLAEVAKEQAVFSFTNTQGTLVGLRGPAFVRGLGVPGWHWHYLTQDRTRGGHVLAFALAAGASPSARYQRLSRLELILPKQGLPGLDLARDRGAELKAVESGR